MGTVFDHRFKLITAEQSSSLSLFAMPLIVLVPDHRVGYRVNAEANAKVKIKSPGGHAQPAVLQGQTLNNFLGCPSSIKPVSQLISKLAATYP